MTTTCSFDDLGLHESLLRGVYSLGMTKPSPVQQLAVPTVCDSDTTNTDVKPTYYLKSRSGTGKTLTCILASLQKFCTSKDRGSTPPTTYRTLHITQTREICVPTSYIYRMLVKYLSRPPTILCLDSVITQNPTSLTTTSTSILADRSQGSNCDLHPKSDIDEADIVITTLSVLLDHTGQISPSTFDAVFIDDMDEMMSRNKEDTCVQLLSIVPIHATVVMTGATAVDEKVGTYWPLRKVQELVVQPPRCPSDYTIFQVQGVTDEFLVDTLSYITSMWPDVSVLVCESAAAAKVFQATHATTFSKPVGHNTGERWISIGTPNYHNQSNRIEKSLLIFTCEPSLEELTRTLALFEGRVHAVVILTPTHADQLAKLLNIVIAELPDDFSTMYEVQSTTPSF